MLVKMLLHHTEALADTLANCNAWNDNDKLAPAIALVQLEHGLDVNIGFTGTGFHFHLQRAATELCDKGIRCLDVVSVLDVADIGKKLAAVKLYAGICKAHIQFLI